MFQKVLHERLRKSKFSYCTMYCEVYRVNEIEQRTGADKNTGRGDLR